MPALALALAMSGMEMEGGLMLMPLPLPLPLPSRLETTVSKIRRLIINHPIPMNMKFICPQIRRLEMLTE
jgi:predicted PP-loop superfamily ATPase